MASTARLNITALNQQFQPLVQAAFWGALAMAALLPVAAAAGGIVAGTLEKKFTG